MFILNFPANLQSSHKFMDTLFKARYSRSDSLQHLQVDIYINAHELGIVVENKPTMHFASTSIQVIEHKAHSLSIQILADGILHTLEITDRHFIHLFEVYTNRATPKPSRTKLIGWVAAITLLFIGSIWLFFAVLVPSFSGWLSGLVPVSYEQKLGKLLKDGMISNQQIDSTATKHINQYFQLLHPESPYTAEITVVESDVMNAFALPGGYIVVYTGLLDSLPSHEALAGLLAHEFGHVHLRHSTRNIFRSLAGYVIISLITGDMGGFAAIILQQAEQLQSLGYSRKLEQEADQFALQLLHNNQLSINGMIGLFELLKSSSQEAPGEWLSTHPDLQKRIDFAKNFRMDTDPKEVSNDSLGYYYNQIKLRHDKSK
jgi:Zn-dependent protease with chaperone function